MAQTLVPLPPMARGPPCPLAIWLLLVPHTRKTPTTDRSKDTAARWRTTEDRLIPVLHLVMAHQIAALCRTVADLPILAPLLGKDLLLTAK